MILSRAEIQEAVDRGEIIFSPEPEERQWGDASIDMRLGFKFTKFKKSDVIIPLAKGLNQISDTGLWDEETFDFQDKFGKRKSYCIEPDEFILMQPWQAIS